MARTFWRPGAETPATRAREKLWAEADVSRRNVSGISGFLADIIGTVLPVAGVVIEGVNTLLGASDAARIARKERQIEVELAAPLPMQPTTPATPTGGPDMSIWSQLGTAVVGGWTSSMQARSARRTAQASATAAPGSGQLLSSLTGLAGWGGAAAGVVTGGVSRAARWCARNPGRCTIMGGLTAVEAYLSSTGKLPPSRRSRGITGRELKAFKRVSRVVSKYCAPTKRAMRSPALRGGKSCR